MPEWNWFEMSSPRTRWVQVFARLKPGQTVGIGAGAAAGAVHADPSARDTLPGAKNWSRLRSASSSSRAGSGREGGDRLLAAPQRLLDAAHRADVHGRPGAADRVRQCRQPADRARVCAAARDCRPAVARRLAPDSSSGSCSSRAWCSRSPAARLGLLLAVWMTRGLIGLIPTDGQPLLIRAEPDWRILAFTFALTLITGIVFGLLPALRASRPDTWGTLKDTVGAVAGAGGHLPAQGARRRAGGAQLPAAVRRRAVRPQPGQPAHHRHRRRTWTIS